MTDAERQRLDELAASGAVIAYWRSDIGGKACNGGHGRVAVGMVQSVAGPLKICTRAALHGTRNPVGYNGDALWLVALIGPIQVLGDKVAALQREVIARIGVGP